MIETERNFTQVEIDSHNSSSTLEIAEQKLGFEDGALQCPDLESYQKNLEYSWIHRVLEYVGPELDSRLAVPLGGSLVYSSVRKPDLFPDIVRSGETTSWNFQYRDKFIKIWTERKQALISAIKQAQTKSELDARLSEIKEVVANLMEVAIDNYATYMGVSKDSIIIAGSGAHAALVARKILKPESTAAVTQENGGEVIGMLDDKSDAIGLRYDIESDTEIRTNIPKSQTEVTNEYIAKLKNGARFIPFTVCSKSGLRYDLVSQGEDRSALEQVMEYVMDHNQKHPDDTIEVVLDVVQLAGREKVSDLQHLFKTPGICGIFHTASKFPGATSHVGTLLLTERGKQLYKENGGSISADDQLEHQVVFAPDTTISQVDILTMLRAIDNADAIIEADKIRNHPDYNHVLGLVRASYERKFNQAGFRILENQTPTIIALEAPYIKNALPSDIDGVFLSILAEKGNDTSFGGFLLHGKEPILRFGVPLALLKAILDKNMYNERELSGMIQESFNEFGRILDVAKKATEDELN